MIDWDKERAHKFASVEPPKDWPIGVRPISINGLNLFGIDQQNRLYWDGQRVAFTLRLENYQIFLLTLASVGAFLSGASDALTYFQIKLFG